MRLKNACNSTIRVEGFYRPYTSFNLGRVVCVIINKYQILVSDLVFTSDDLAPLNDLLVAEGNSVYLTFSTGAYQSYDPGMSREFGPLMSAKNESYDLSSILGSLQASGGGNFTLNAESTNGLTIYGGGGNITSTQSTTAGSGAMIVYTYDAIPEPGSMMLVSLLPGVFVFRRRRI